MCGGEFCTPGKCEPWRTEKRKTEPERSDGRIPAAYTTADIVGMPKTLICICGVENCTPSAEHGTWCGMHREYVACLEREVAALKAQRSAGRIEAGSVQFGMEMSGTARYDEFAMIKHADSGIAHAASAKCGECQDSRNGAVAQDEEKIKP